ncbi:hypothetical protein, partial [Pedobacter sp. ASV12]|uniref:hypothetical protein n=1 Tax=Pedobacter sp. ASV12 TaxID=2795120 RepID=UPI0018EAA826
ISFEEDKQENKVLLNSVQKPEILKNEFSNIRELSALQFSIDAIIDILSINSLDEEDEDEPSQAIDLILNMLTEFKSNKTPGRKFRDRIIFNISEAWRAPENLGISATPASNWKENMDNAINDLKEVIESVRRSNAKNHFQLFSIIVAKCKEMLEERKLKKKNSQTIVSILYNIHNRLITSAVDQDSEYLIKGLEKGACKEMANYIISILQY